MRLSKARLIVQLLFLIIAVFLPAGLCLIDIGIVKILCPYGGLMRAIKISLLTVTIPILLTIALGRFFCGWICPVGTILDLISTVKKRKPKLSLHSLKYGFTIGFIAASILCGTSVFCSICPVKAICSISRFAPYLFPALLLPLALEVLGNRAWCMFICPIGGLLALLSNLKVVGIKIDLSKCVKCSKCVEACRLKALTLRDLKEGFANKAECILCMECVDACKLNAISLGSLYSLRCNNC